MNSRWYRERKKPKPTYRVSNGTPSKQLREAILRSKARDLALADISAQAIAFNEEFLQLEQNEPESSRIKSLIRHAFTLTRDGVSLKSRLQSLGIPSSTRSDGQIEKIANYWYISTKLAEISRSHRDLFRNMKVERIPHFNPHCIPNTSEKRFTHAEVQLIVYYQILPKPWPRAIGSAKAACFLCNAFIQAYGHYHISRAHRQVYHQWWVPDLQEYSTKAVNRLRGALTKVHKEVRKEISITKNTSGRSVWVNIPNQSAINLAKLTFSNPSASTIDSRPGAASVRLVQQVLDTVAVDAGKAGSQDTYPGAAGPFARTAVDSNIKPSTLEEQAGQTASKLPDIVVSTTSDILKIPESTFQNESVDAADRNAEEPHNSLKGETLPTSTHPSEANSPHQQHTISLHSSHRSTPQMIEEPMPLSPPTSPMPDEPLQAPTDERRSQRPLKETSTSTAYPPSTEEGDNISDATAIPYFDKQKTLSKAEPVCLDLSWLKIYACFGEEVPLDRTRFSPSEIEDSGSSMNEEEYMQGRIGLNEEHELHSMFNENSKASGLQNGYEKWIEWKNAERIDISRMKPGEQTLLKVSDERKYGRRRELPLVFIGEDGAKACVTCEWIE